MFEVVGRGAGKAHTLRSLKNEVGGGWKGVGFGLGLTGERWGVRSRTWRSRADSSCMAEAEESLAVLTLALPPVI